jgi:Tol biopolymer transport system component
LFKDIKGVCSLKNIFISLVWLSIAVSTLFAQQPTTDFPKLTGPYMGQKPPGRVAEIFAPGIISTISLEHSKISFSKDGSSFYWAEIPSLKKGNRTQQRIWFVQQNGDSWSKPSELEIPQIALATPTLSPDGKELFFIGSEDRLIKDPGQVRNDVYVLDLQSKSIQNISNTFPTLKNCWSLSIADNGDIYYDCGNSNVWEIYVIKKQNEGYSSPQKLPSVINDGNTNIHPFISPDGSFLLFSSSRSEDSSSLDLYVSFKDKEGQWTSANNLGKDINSEARERFPSLSPDGKYIFFTRRDSDFNEIFWVDAKIIEELKPKGLK